MPTTAESKSKGFFRSSPSTAFDQYLQDIQKLPLISDAEEERRLARRAQAGDEKAAERLVTANLRFVISYVKKYQGHGLDLSELVAIGNEGLLKAVRKFDPEQGVKFISYAVWWVRQAVLKALAEQTRSVRIPLNQNSQLIKLARAQTVLSQVLKRDPTDHEIGRLLEETPEAVRSAKQMSATEISLIPLPCVGTRMTWLESNSPGVATFRLQATAIPIPAGRAMRRARAEVNSVPQMNGNAPISLRTGSQSLELMRGRGVLADLRAPHKLFAAGI